MQKTIQYKNYIATITVDTYRQGRKDKKYWGIAVNGKNIQYTIHHAQIEELTEDKLVSVEQEFFDFVDNKLNVSKEHRLLKDLGYTETRNDNHKPKNNLVIPDGE